MQTQMYVRRPLEVEAVQVTKDNLYEVAKWCQGLVLTDKQGVKYVKVKVINSSANMLREADVGCWVLKSQRGFKVYTDEAFEYSFIPAEERKSA